MPIAVVGSVAYDGVETPHGKVDRMLGGACTYIALAASYFNPVQIVAVVGDDFDQADADFLSSRGIDLTGSHQIGGSGQRIDRFGLGCGLGDGLGHDT